MRRLFVLLLPLLVFSACKPNLLPDTSVPDTKQNRAVIAFLDQYRQAFQQRSVADVMALVSADYFENGGTPQTDDDYDYSQLQTKLNNTFDKLESVVLSFHVQNIAKRDQYIDVVYYFVERALVKYPTESQWMSANDLNRVVLKLKGKNYKDGFEIMSGL